MPEVNLPENLRMRPATLADIDQVARVMNAYEIEYGGEAETNADFLRHVWEQPARRLEENMCVVVTSEDEIVAWSAVRDMQHVKLDLDLVALSSYRGQVELPLMRWVEERAREHVAAAPEDMRVVLGTWTYANDKEQCDFWESLNFQLVRSFWTMKRELGQMPEQPRCVPDVSLYTVKDLQASLPEGDDSLARALFDAHEEAFSDHWGHIPNTYENWRMRMRPDADLSMYYLAMAGDEIAAYARCANEQGQGWVHTLGVRRAWRRKGLGLALLHHAFGEFYRRDLKEVYLRVDAQSLTGATYLYERAGMHVACQYITYEKVLRSGRDIRTLTLG